MIILFMKWVLLTGLSVVCHLGFVILAGLFGFILAGTDIRKFIHDGQFWATKIQMDNFVPQTHRQTPDTRTDGHTRYLYIY